MFLCLVCIYIGVNKDPYSKTVWNQHQQIFPPQRMKSYLQRSILDIAFCINNRLQCPRSWISVFLKRPYLVNVVLRFHLVYISSPPQKIGMMFRRLCCNSTFSNRVQMSIPNPKQQQMIVNRVLLLGQGENINQFIAGILMCKCVLRYCNRFPFNYHIVGIMLFRSNTAIIFSTLSFVYPLSNRGLSFGILLVLAFVPSAALISSDMTWLPKETGVLSCVTGSLVSVAIPSEPETLPPKVFEECWDDLSHVLPFVPRSFRGFLTKFFNIPSDVKRQPQHLWFLNRYSHIALNHCDHVVKHTPLFQQPSWQ